jgi:phosphopantothenoylcysteine decarboxylase/phosphopantothenate--cysteine ligase
MHAAIVARAPAMDVVVMAAAVADYRPATRAPQKIKKREGAGALGDGVGSGVTSPLKGAGAGVGDGAGDLQLALVRNPDILAELGATRTGTRPVLVGFALETEDVVTHARAKLVRKKVDLVVANHASDGFGGNENVATIVRSEGDERLPKMSKDALADRVLDAAISRLNSSLDG